LKEIGRHAPI